MRRWGVSYLPRYGYASCTTLPSRLKTEEGLPLGFGEKCMRPALAVWIIRGCHLASILVALWWPALLFDPLYSPRHMRLTRQELSLPNGAIPQTAEERALAIFWMWEQRTVVEDSWLLGPCRGLRDANGRNQTVVVLACIWLVRGGLFVWERSAGNSAQPRHFS